MTRLLGVLTVALLALGPSSIAVEASAATPPEVDGSHARKVPTRAQWLADVKAAMQGSRGDMKARVAAATADEKLAVNFDIDNTVIATYYDGGGAIPRMRRFARMLDRLDVAVVFNAGRVATQQARTVTQLTRAGFPVTEVCLRPKGGTLAVGKQRCRDHLADAGYTLIANVGNNDTDFVGDGYERAYRLPNYGVLG